MNNIGDLTVVGNVHIAEEIDSEYVVHYET